MCNHVVQNTNDTNEIHKKFGQVILKNKIQFLPFANICKIYIPQKLVCIQYVNSLSSTVQLVHVTPSVKILGRKPDAILVVSSLLEMLCMWHACSMQILLICVTRGPCCYGN